VNSNTGSDFRWFYYCCYALVLTLVLLYALFPGAKFKAHCVRQAESLFAGTTCSMGGLSYDFPFGLTLQDVLFADTNQRETPLFRLNSLTLSPVLSQLGKVVELRGEGYSGQFSGTLLLEGKGKRFSLETLKIQNLNLGEMKPLHEVLGREISGLVDFSGSFSGVVNQYLAGKAQGKVRLRDGKIVLVLPVLALNAIDLQEMEMDAKYDRSELQLSKGKMKGRELSVDFSSTVQVTSPWYISGITVMGSVAPQAGFINGSVPVQNEVRALQRQYKKATIPFRIHGSLQKPTFRFGL